MARHLHRDVLMDAGPDKVPEGCAMEVVDRLVGDAGGEARPVKRHGKLPDRLALAVEDPGRDVCRAVVAPSLPGVFFFDNEELFVKGVVQLKSNVSTHFGAREPVLLGGSIHYDDENTATQVRTLRHSVTRQSCWRQLKRDDSASFTSSSLPPDASSTPPLS